MRDAVDQSPPEAPQTGSSANGGAEVTSAAGGESATALVTPGSEKEAYAPSTSTRLTREEKLAHERTRILAAAASGRTHGLYERIAWLLCTQSAVRDSDIALQLAYWREYEQELYEEFMEAPETIYKKLTRLTSVARARAKIQNQHHLFLASPEIRKRRGQLSEEERERHASNSPPSPTITVYADESGKTDGYLVVGSVWFVDPADTFRLASRVEEWQSNTGFNGEFHFSEITARTLPHYFAFVDLVIGEIPLISFKNMFMPRAGVRSIDEAFDLLFYELIRQGLQHEHETGRAPMPRRLILWKDQEAGGQGRDVLILTKLRQALTAASRLHFDGKLGVEMCETLNSSSQPLLQLADLYTSSINRTMVRAQASSHPKDVLADYLLERVRSLGGVDQTRRLSVGSQSDVEVTLHL